jgi:hypothetical protein
VITHAAPAPSALIRHSLAPLARFGLLVALATLSAGGLAGCSLSQPYPSKEKFSVDVAGIPAATGVVPATLRVENVRIASPYDQLAFIYRTGATTYKNDYYRSFITEPGAIFTSETIDALSARRGFAAVVGPASPVEAGYWLESNISDLYGDFRDPGRPLAFVRARFFLLKQSVATTTVVGEWTLDAAEPLPAGDADQLPAGWGRAYTTILTRLAPQLDAAAAGDPALNEKPAAAGAAGR